MTGVYIKHLVPCLQLQDRSTIEILNGQIDVRNIKLLTVKAGSIIGGQSHAYHEAKYMISGEMRYRLASRGGERSEVTLRGGDLMILAPYIFHEAEFIKDTLVMDFSDVGFFSTEFNNQSSRIGVSIESQQA
jgi:uncharacterized RmlC-like cupin family protein